MKSILNNNNRGVGKKKHKNLKLERRLLVKSVTTVLNINETGRGREMPLRKKAKEAGDQT